MGSGPITNAELARRPQPQSAAAEVEVIAHGRAYDAHQLRLGGVDWPEIAKRTGYLDGRIAAMSVTAYLQKVAAERAPDHRRAALQLELDRLDRLQAAFWAMALAGDYHAAEVALKVIARRCKVMGFDNADELAMAAPRTVVIGGNSEEYLATLKRLIKQQGS